MSRTWHRPPHKFRSAGAAGMTMTQTMIGLIVVAPLVIITLMTALPGMVKLFAMLALAVLFAGWIVRGPSGRSIWETLWDITARVRQVSRGEHVYRAGPFTTIPHGTPLPGVAASSRIVDVAACDDAESFALIHLPHRRSYTLVLRAYPQGREWVSDERADMWVARVGDALAMLGQSPDVLAVVPVIETVPESGQRASRLIRSQLTPGAPTIAQAAVVEAVENVPVASVRTDARIAITFAADTAFRKRDSGEVATDVSRRLSAITAAFADAGVQTRPMKTHELIAITRRAFSPGDEIDLEEALMTGEPTGLTWQDVGPCAAADEHASYVHDSMRSLSWTMSMPPESSIDPSVLAQLLAPRNDLPRKRVAFIYEPYTPAEGTRIVNKDAADAQQSIRTTIGRVSERQWVRKEQADAARHEQARGAGVTRLSIVITASAPRTADPARTETLVTNLTLSAALQVRPATAQQGVMFLASLGIGIVASQHTSVPERLAE